MNFTNKASHVGLHRNDIFYGATLQAFSSQPDAKGEVYREKDISQCTHIVSFTLPNVVANADADKKISLGSDIMDSFSPDRDYIFQTTNPVVRPDPAKTLGVSWYERYVIHARTLIAQVYRDARLWQTDQAAMGP